ncbi:MAG: hypothetical protein K9I69_00355 [Ignavibacteriales bacterium]|nr:hypothetical protein [Ignavibacteriales bacterium]MCF8307214.1 hypothetical protein [Ignavibacteriales bacterium]MCF8315219.1 hypothetical protein [Ignavibacteriales bacterium]MCF8438494.1 hypothetical protein [Ignavibacteriales bacterium]
MSLITGNKKQIFLLYFLLAFSIIDAQKIKSPDEFFPGIFGQRPMKYYETVEYFNYLVQNSPMIGFESGLTHQGRKLYHYIISSTENMSRLGEIKKNVSIIADPGNPAGASSDLISRTPGVAMMMYSIHGNEASGTDAAIRLAHYLSSGDDPKVREILQNLVVIIYPMENPDGRERFLSQAEQWVGTVPNPDSRSMPHSGLWPSGRTNHYHFDLNRDWIFLTQPETRSRVKIITEWNPQLVVDAHEMGSFSSFLFNPPREPINPNIDSRILEWWNVFGRDLSEAFDKQGWSYYSGEWLEEWYPGYGSSWPSYLGAVAILYEQARTSGTLVKRPDGTVLTFAKSVDHQFTASMANLITASARKDDLLKLYRETRISKEKKNGKAVKYFVFSPTENKSRLNNLVEILNAQSIEIFTADRSFKAEARSYYETEQTKVDFPAGSVVIPLNQPVHALIKALLEFDTRFDNKFLQWERESILKGEGSQLYEVTTWSLPMAYDLKCYEIKDEIKTGLTKFRGEDLASFSFPGESRYGYLFEYFDDTAVKFLLDLLNNGVKIRTAVKDFSHDGKNYKKGTMLIRNIENDTDLEEKLHKFSQAHNVRIIPANSARSSKGSDLGGDDFRMLRQPKIAIAAGDDISMDSFGTIWFLLDKMLGNRVSLIPSNFLSRSDLSNYNVLIIPSARGWAQGFFTKPVISSLRAWVNDGGTLILSGNSSVMAADSSVRLSGNLLRSQNLDKISDLYTAINHSRLFNQIKIDSLNVWEKGIPESPISGKDTLSLKSLRQKEKLYEKFMPQGVILKGELNLEQWLTFGMTENVPVFYSSGEVLYSKNPNETVARFPDENLRLSGLLWPEAGFRLKNSSFLTRENSGRGQIISFVEDPFFRAAFHGTARLFLNAAILGPGLGTNWSAPW